jgi:hypothetical protein
MQVNDITYSTKPLTLGDARLLQRIPLGDFDATIKFIARRTSLTEEQVEELDANDVEIIVGNIAHAVEQAATLAKLGRQLG